MKRLILGLAILTIVWCGAAQADVMFDPGNHPQSNEQNILLNDGDTGMTVFGLTNQTNIQVQFSSAESLVVNSAGQAKIGASDELVNGIAITFPGGEGFQDIIFDPHTGSGNATVTAVANEPEGGTQIETFTYALGNGENFLTIVAQDGETLASVSIVSSEGFEDLRQVRISGVGASVGVIPEPTTMLLLGSGLIGLAGYGRKKFFKK